MGVRKHEMKVSSKSKPAISVLELLRSTKQQPATSVNILSGLDFDCENVDGKDEKNSTYKAIKRKITTCQVK